MAQTSFSERLQKIEKVQARPVSERIVAGLCEELENEAAGKKSKKRSRPVAGKTIRFGAGFLLMFASFLLARRMSEVQALLDGTDLLAPFTTMIMAGVTASIIFVLLFFAFKLQRAVFRILREPARLPFALGMIIGLASGLGPVELADTMIAQLN